MRKWSCIFGYPGGVTLPFYDALYDIHIKHVLVRHEQNAAFAAAGLCARHRQGRRLLRHFGPRRDQPGHRSRRRHDGFHSDRRHHRPGEQQTYRQRRVSGSRHVRHHPLRPPSTISWCKNIAELPHTIHEAFYLAASGRPGPVLVDITKDVFQGQRPLRARHSIHLPGYKVFTEGHAGQIRRAAQMIWEAERPFVYAGGGIVAANASEELRDLSGTARSARRLHADGPGRLCPRHRNFISMPGMHGSYAANMGMTECDLLIALGTRFDDRVTGRLAAFAPHAK